MNTSADDIRHDSKIHHLIRVTIPVIEEQMMVDKKLLKQAK